MRLLKRILPLALLLIPLSASAQSGYTNVTATVHDSNGTLYTNSPFTVTFFDPGTSGKLPSLFGATAFQQVFTGYATDSFGHININIADNSVIAAASGATGTQWRFNICTPQGSFPLGPYCGNITLTISGATQDITASITPVMPILPNAGSIIGCSSLGAIAYASGTNALTCNSNLSYNSGTSTVTNIGTIINTGPISTNAANGNISLVNPTPATGFATASNTPILSLSGQGWTGAASALDTVTMQDILTGTVSQAANFTISHTAGPWSFSGITIDNTWGGFTVRPATSFLNSVIVNPVLQSPQSSYDAAALTLSAAGNAAAGLTTYTCSCSLSAPIAGMFSTVAGFTNGANNGRFMVQSATNTTLVLYNPSGVAETHAGTATTDQPYAGQVGQWRLMSTGQGTSWGIRGNNSNVLHQISAVPIPGAAVNNINLALNVEGDATDGAYHAFVTSGLVGPSGDHGYELGAITDGTGTNPTAIRMGVFGGVNGAYVSEANGTFFHIAQVIKATSAGFATATTAGTCVQNTTAVTGAATTMAVSVSPVSTPGVGAVWSAFVSSAGNVTINECAVATSAGGTIAFNIRVTP